MPIESAEVTMQAKTPIEVDVARRPPEPAPDREPRGPRRRPARDGQLRPAGRDCRCVGGGCLGRLIVLGIDPGTAATGYGIVERNGSKLRLIDYGCLETVSTPGSCRVGCCTSTQAVTELIAEHKPALVGVERLFFNRNVQTAFAVGQARGVVLLAAAQHGVPVYEYGPHEVKMAVTGYGRADKDQVQRMVQVLLGMTMLPRPDDAADALAVAICIAHGQRAARGLDVPPDSARSAQSAVIAFVEGRVVVDRRRFGRRRRRRRRLPRLLRTGHADRAARRRSRPTAHPPPGARGPAGAVRLPHDRGAWLLRAADHGHRRRPEGRPGDRLVAAGGRPAAGHPAGRRGAC